MPSKRNIGHIRRAKVVEDDSDSEDAPEINSDGIITFVDEEVPRVSAQLNEATLNTSCNSQSQVAVSLADIEMFHPTLQILEENQRIHNMWQGFFNQGAVELRRVIDNHCAGRRRRIAQRSSSIRTLCMSPIDFNLPQIPLWQEFGFFQKRGKKKVREYEDFYDKKQNMGRKVHIEIIKLDEKPPHTHTHTNDVKIPSKSPKPQGKLFSDSESESEWSTDTEVDK
ncbi:uncharacterized protein LOC119681735 [Teleopsis dalmanni]|uniref:uncharacterized protein LOC119681735 n=1 Tax=Teleopsis dalmanni TaxID=139649 RepID=UPI0018CD84F6|nr:uncharacterized protein LOC119681735 [Teleopsis dalmanni]XP_037950932.1 uncharacterized protein LOC119681735 [Teleopsis dalmanni]XP_037950933.1 uncharacterized protein LOC119681735 [Teleopsis dalmanni]XP_037950934.1 uncharacterized protein LOC119681735 [Teleopsis dalmanni]